jgi:arylsulfatase
MSDEERAEAARDMEVYAAMIDYLDEQIGRVLDALRESGEYDNTLIIFFSDNGANGGTAEAYPGQTDEFLAMFDNSLENRGAPGSFVEPGPGWAQASMAPSRMFKAFTAEGGIRAPMLVKLPGEMDNAGSRSHQFLHIRDIMPTVLDVAGVAAPPSTFAGREVLPMQGRSARTLLAGDVDTLDAGFGEVGYELFGRKAFFAGPWKILLMAPPFGTGDWQLYNLEEDPGETNDLSAELPERLAELKGLWEQYRDQNGVLEASVDAAEEIGGNSRP